MRPRARAWPAHPQPYGRAHPHCRADLGRADAVAAGVSPGGRVGLLWQFFSSVGVSLGVLLLFSLSLFWQFLLSLGISFGGRVGLL
jgi:hypothetical protein